MSDGDLSQETHDPRLNRILTEYLEAAEKGQDVTPETWINRYPEFADQLREFCAGHQRLDDLVSPGTSSGEETSEQDAQTLLTGNSPTSNAKDEPFRVRYFGEYELLEEIARGGMGVVYKARQSTLKRIVALKMILSGVLAGDEDVKRFYAEAGAAAKLDHPNIVPIFEIGQHEGQHYFSMAYVAGESLARKVVAGPLPPREAAQLMKKVTEAVTYAHIEGVIHRDLKPANVLLDKDGVPRVTDFGLAKRISPESLSSEAGESAANLTATGQILGTPSYMSPEQAAARSDEVGALADVYSLGAMLYCLLTGRPPFQAASPLDTLNQVLEKDPVPLRHFDPKVPRDLETVCLKCLEKEPRKRYQTANELVEELRRFLDGAPIHARPVSRRERCWRWCKRNPVVSSLATGLAVALVAGFVGVTWQWIRAENETDRAVQQEQLTRRYLYSAYINLAQQAIDSGNMLRAVELLNQLRPELAPSRREPSAQMQSVRERFGGSRAVPATLSGHEDLRSFDWYYLWRQCHRERRTVRLADDGDQLEIGRDAIAVSPNGRFVAIGGRNYGAEPHVGEVRLWDLAAERIVRVFRGEATRKVESLVFSPDVTTLAVLDFGHNGGTADQRIIVWNVETGEQLASLDLSSKWRAPGTRTTGTRPPYSLSDNGRMLAVIGDWQQADDDSWKQGVKVWDFADPQEADANVRFLEADCGKGFRYDIHGQLLSPDGKYLAWDRGRTKVLSDLTSDAEPIVLDAFQVLALSPDSRWIVTLPRSNFNALEIRHCATGQLHRAFEVDIRGMAAAAAFSPDGRLLTFSHDELVGLWDIESGEKLVTLKGHTSDVASVAFSQDGKSVVSVAQTRLEIVGASWAYEAKVWDVDTRYAPETFVANEKGLSALAASPTGDLLATGHNNNWHQDLGVRIWDLSSGNFNEPLLSLKDDSRFDVERLAFGPQGKLLAANGNLVQVGRQVDQLRLWRLNRDEQGLHAERLDSLSIPRITSKVKNSVVSPDGRLVAYVSQTYAPPGDGRSGSYGDETLRLLDVDSGKDRQIPQDVKNWFEYKEAVGNVGAGHHVLGSAFSPDGKRIATSHGPYIVIWDIATGEAITAWGHREMSFQSAETGSAFSPDGQTLATIHSDNSVMLWDVSDAALERIRGELQRRHERYYDPETRRYQGNGEPPTTEPKAILRGHAERILAVTFCADGKTLATGSEDRTVRIWDVATGERRLVLTGHRSPVHSVAITPDGRTLISGDFSGTVRLWRAASEDEVQARSK